MDPTLLPTEEYTPSQSFQPAPKINRFVDYIVDELLSFFIAIFAVAFIGLFVSLLFKTRITGVSSNIMILGAYFIIRYMYYFLSERFLGRTFAKYLTKTQVIDVDGRRSTLRIMGRTFARYIPLDTISIFFNNNRAWHDSMSKTWVVKSNTLPEHMRPKKLQDRIMTGVTILLLTFPVWVIIGLPIYNGLTGGERFGLPATMPADFKLVQLNNQTVDDKDFYSFLYKGDNRTVRINRLIAGFNFESDDPCTGMLPIEIQPFLNVRIQGYDCHEIYQNPQKHHIRAFKQTYTGVDTLQPPSKGIADYYISDPPYRLVIKAESGKVTDDEVINMVKDGLITQKEEDLKKSIK